MSASPAATLPRRARSAPADLVLYYGSYALVPLLGLVQTRVLSRLLEASVFGIIQLVIPLTSVAVISGGLGVPNYILRYYVRDGDRVVTNGLALTVPTTLTVILILITVVVVWPSAIALQAPTPLLLTGLAGLIIATQLSSTMKAALRGAGDHVRYNLLQTVDRVFTVSGAIVGVYLMRGRGVEGFLVGSATGTSLAVLLITGKELGRQLGQIRFHFRRFAPAMLRYGLPVVAILVAGDAFGSAARFLIAWNGLGAAQVAKYAVNYAIAALGIQALYEPLLTYVQPRIFKAWESSDAVYARHLALRATQLFLLASAAATIALVLLQGLVTRVVATDAYLVSRRVFVTIIFANVLIGLYRFLATALLITAQTQILLFCFLAGLTANVLVAAATLGSLGLFGAAIGAIAGAVILVVLVFANGRSLWTATPKQMPIIVEPEMEPHP